MSNLPTNFLLRGLIIGFSIAAPVGPIGVLCVRRTLAHGRISGFISGLGAATADAFYGSLAALGITLVTNFLVAQDNWLRLIGGLFLCYLGIKTSRDKPQGFNGSPPPAEIPIRATTRGRALLADYLSTLFLTLTNPLTILSFAAIFGGLGLAQTADTPSAAFILVGGVFLGSVLWWLLLNTVADLLRARFMGPSGLRWINILSGWIILVFGVLALSSIILPWVKGLY